MTMQTDLFALASDPEPIEDLSADENGSVDRNRCRPLAVPCAFLNRANKPCQKLGKRPIMMDGKQMDCRGRPLIACDPYCFNAIEPTPAGSDEDDAGGRETTSD